MDDCTKQRLMLANEFKECQLPITAIGDETRQSIILAILENDTVGMRVGDITKKVHLSRPAVSHHLKILKDAKIISVRKKGTKNYYYMDINTTSLKKLYSLVNHIYNLVEKATENHYPNNHLEEE